MEPAPASTAQPLWTRVDRDRWRLVALVFEVCLSIAACGAVVAFLLVMIAVALGAPAPGSSGWDGPSIAAAVAWATWAVFLLALAWALWTLSRADRTVLGRLGAVRVPVGALPELKGVLKDMGLAAGYSPAPEPWVLPFDSINACAVARGRKRPAVAFTRGFVEKLPPAEQRAVFANLLARLASGDAAWGTGAFALMAPVFAMRDRDLSGENDALFQPTKPSEEQLAWLGTSDEECEQDVSGALVIGFLFYLPLVVVTEVLASAHQRNALVVAESADALGMLLLKDPREMMRALKRVLPSDNMIPVSGSALGIIFYAWPGWDAPIGEEDPELRRVARLREVLGAEGSAA